MKQLLLLGLCIVPLHCFFAEHIKTFELMDQLFAEMHERTYAHKIDAPDYNVNIQRKGNFIEIALAVPSFVTTNDVSVQTENGALYVVIQAQQDRVELEIRDQTLIISAATIIKREEKDEKGTVVSHSSGSSHMSQRLSLPAKVDLSKMPTADLSNGVLTLTLAVKGATKIPVTTSNAPQTLEEEPVREIPYEPTLGQDVFKETFEK